MKFMRFIIRVAATVLVATLVIVMVVSPILALLIILSLRVPEKQVTAIIGQFSTTIGALDSSMLALFELFGLILACVIIYFIFRQFTRIYSSPEFVFEGFSNDGDLLTDESKPSQFSELAWEELANQFRTLQWGEYVDGSVNRQSSTTDPDIPHNPVLEGLLPPLKERNFIGLKGTALFDRIKLVEGQGPDNFSVLISAVRFMSAIVPPPMIRIASHLQRQRTTSDDDSPLHTRQGVQLLPRDWLDRPNDKVGITLEFISSIKPSDHSITHSFWEDETRKSSSNQASSESEEVYLQQRYMKLLSPTMRWLILECYKQKEEIRIAHMNFNFFLGVKRRKAAQAADQARLLYILGVLYYASKEEFKDQLRQKEFFLQRAIKYLLEASIARKEWYLPYLYRANIHHFEMVEQESPEREKSLQKALALYQLALDCEDTQGEEQENIENQHRVMVAKALTALDSYDNDLIDQAYKALKAIEAKQDPVDFSRKRLDCAAYLYDLATWYELAYQRDLVCKEEPSEEKPSTKQLCRQELRKEALRYLAYSSIHSQSLWDQAETALQFSPMRLRGDFGALNKELKALKEELGKEQRELAELSPKDLKIQIEYVLKKVLVN